MKTGEFLSGSGYFASIIQLRAANFRFIPITMAEVLYQLDQAKVSDDGQLVETQELEVIRRYVAT